MTAFAKRAGISVLGIIHVNKSGSGDALNSIMCSRAFGSVARAVLMAVKNPEDGICTFGLAKNNLGSKEQPAYHYQIIGEKVADTDEGEVWTGKVEWQGNSDRSIDEVIFAISEGGMDGTSAVDAWKGVSSAGVSWSYDSEASAVSDDTPTLAQPSVPVYSARGYIPYSIEVGQDYPGFAEEMGMLLSQGFIDLLASQTMVGSGSSQPRGLFTAMAATTTSPSHVTVTTAGVIGAIDIRAAWAALPERFRSRANWVMSTSVEAKVRALGNNLSIADFTVDLTKDGVPVLTGREVVVSDYAPNFTGTTGTENFAIVGDLSNFLIVSRAGMSVELIPTVFDQSTGRPSGQRAWYAYARHGFDVVNANGLRILANS